MMSWGLVSNEMESLKVDSEERARTHLVHKDDSAGFEGRGTDREKIPRKKGKTRPQNRDTETDDQIRERLGRGRR